MEALLLLIAQRGSVRPERELDDDSEENAHFGGLTDAKEQSELEILTGDTLRGVETELMLDLKQNEDRISTHRKDLSKKWRN